MLKTIYSRHNIEVKNFTTREINDDDIEIICSWVINQRMLTMISGDIGNGLSPNILRKWINSSIRTIVVADYETNTPLGFCTLTSNELLNIKPFHVELCHLVVNPNYPKYYIGVELCTSAIEIASTFGFKFIICRISPTNLYGISLANSQNCKEITESNLPVGFTWYLKSLL